MTQLDVHAHYYTYKENNWIKDAENKKQIIILNGIDAESNRKCIDLEKKYNRIKCALGFHPTFIKTEKDVANALAEITRIKQVKDKIVAIGEIGLDYFHEKDSTIKEMQKEVFSAYIKLAEELKLPIILHTRNALKDILPMITNFKGKVILHCLEASEKNIKECLKREYYFTIPTAVSRNEMFQRLVNLVPISRMFTETDAPYQGPEKGVNAMPSDIQFALDYIASVKGMVAEEVEKVIFANWQKVF